MQYESTPLPVRFHIVNKHYGLMIFDFEEMWTCMLISKICCRQLYLQRQSNIKFINFDVFFVGAYRYCIG